MDSNNDLKDETSLEEEAVDGDQTIPPDNDPNESRLTAKTDQSIDCQKSTSDAMVEPKEESSEDQTRHQYSKEQLIAISKQSSARIRPKVLDNCFNAKNGLWDPEKWMESRVSSYSKHNYSKRDGNENFVKKANNDLKDKVIEEETQIILSPQRGSFGTGCHVSTTSFSSNKTGIDSRNRDQYNDRHKDDSLDSHRQQMTRRIGTGRVIPKDKDRPNDWFDRSYDRDRGYDLRNEGRNDPRNDPRDNRDRNDDYNDRRNRNRFFERRQNPTVQRNYRYEDNDRRYKDHRYSRDEEEEPEWFTEGPVSKHDTIELRGFDDDSDHRKENSKKSMEEKPSKERSDEKSSEIESRKAMEMKDNRNEKTVEKNDVFDVNESFNTDDWFGVEYQTPDKNISSLDAFSDTVTNRSEDNGKSRFNRWFKGSPTQPPVPQTNDNSQTHAMKGLNRGQNQMEGKGTGIRSHGSNQTPQSLTTDSNERKIFDLLKCSNQMPFEPFPNNKLDPTKAVNVSDIEANLRQMTVNNNEEQPSDRKAFDKFFNVLMNKKSVQNQNVFQRSHPMSEPKAEVSIYQANNSNIIIPKGQHQNLTAPSLLQMLSEEENKERMKAMNVDALRNARGLVSNAPISQSRVTQNGSHVVVMPPMGQNVSNSAPGQDWQLMLSLMQNVRQSQTNTNAKHYTNQEMTYNTNYILQNALLQRQQTEGGGRVQTVPENNTRTNTPIRGMSSMPSNHNFLTPTSVMRKMNCEKEKDLSNKWIPGFNAMSEPNASHKYMNDHLIPKQTPQTMRPIVKSNSIDSPLIPMSPQSMSFNSTPDSSLNAFNLQSQPLYFVEKLPKNL